MKTERVWFEVRVGDGSNPNTTLEEARAYVADMKTGFKLKHPEMTEENRSYHKRVSEKAEIYKIIQSAEKIV